MSKLSEDVRIGILGAAAGLFSSSVSLLIARIDSYYSYISRLGEINYPQYDRPVEDLSWIPTCAWQIVLSVVASLLVHRYLASRFKSPFLLWQVVGIASLFGWALTLFLAVSLECLVRGNLYPLEQLAASDIVGPIAKYTSTVFACSVFYGSVINASYRQYTYQLESEVALECCANEVLPFQR